MYIWLPRLQKRTYRKISFFISTDYFLSIILIYNMSTFLFQLPGITVKMIRTVWSTNGRSCYAHHICGSLLTLDVVVHFRRLQIVDNGKERSVIVAYHVTDGIDSCCVGFLKRELTKFSRLYEGVLAQVSSVWSLLSSSHTYLKKQSGRWQSTGYMTQNMTSHKIKYFILNNIQVKHQTMRLFVFKSILKYLFYYSSSNKQ